MWKKIKIPAINLLVLLILLGGLEFYFRVIRPAPPPYDIANGLQLTLRPYTMFANPPYSKYPEWYDIFTSARIPSTVKANNEGFNDKHDFSLTEPYQKAGNERVVLFVGGSTAWGVGATSVETTIAGRIEHHLNIMQKDLKYTVINLGMGSWIAYQQYIAMELWGAPFDPDWVVVMDGHNDAGVGCSYSQGVMNPLFFPVIKSYVDGYLGNGQTHPVFYRGWIENQVIKYSAAYRVLTGKDYVPNSQVFDATNTDATREETRKVILPTKLGESRQMLAFYLKAEEAMLNLFPKAGYILSTQPMVNQFTGDFTDVYADMTKPEAHQTAMDKRQRDVENYLAAHANEWCNAQNFQPSFVYLYVDGAIELERLAERAHAQGRPVEYANTGLLFPNERNERMPYFIDPAHVSDKGADVLGKFYAERILAAASGSEPTRESTAARSRVVAPAGSSTSDKVTEGIYVTSASYGRNCGASPGNVTRVVGGACNGKQTCDYRLDVNVLGDPAQGCSKDFKAEFKCAPGNDRFTQQVAPEAGLGSQLLLSCPARKTE
jgi:hypothetical protein